MAGRPLTRARRNPTPVRRLSAMQTIIVKYGGPTNSRGSGYTAKASSAPGSVRVGTDYSLDGADNAAIAARGLLEKLGWGGTWYVGSIPDGYVFVCADASTKAFTLK